MSCVGGQIASKSFPVALKAQGGGLEMGCSQGAVGFYPVGLLPPTLEVRGENSGVGSRVCSQLESSTSPGTGREH